MPNTLTSCKKIGKYEHVIMQKLMSFFTNEKYYAIPHVRLNISWGSIISDIDMLLIKDDTIGIIEIKSSHDHLQNAKRQILNIVDYVDFAYIATDFKPRKLPISLAGWIYVHDEVVIKKHPKPISKTPSAHSVNSLPKKCLKRYLKHKGNLPNGITKYELTNNIMSHCTKNLKNEVKTMATCGQECDTNCPIWNFDISDRMS